MSHLRHNAAAIKEGQQDVGTPCASPPPKMDVPSMPWTDLAYAISGPDHRHIGMWGNAVSDRHSNTSNVVPFVAVLADDVSSVGMIGNDSDEALMLRVAGGDRDSFACLYQRHTAAF